MPKFVVTKSVDAHVHYSTVVQADTADRAKQFAREHEHGLTWHNIGTCEYDARDWDNIEPESVHDDFLLTIPGLGPTPVDPASSPDPEPNSTPSSAVDRQTPDTLMSMFGELDTFIEL